MKKITALFLLLTILLTLCACGSKSAGQYPDQPQTGIADDSAPSDHDHAHSDEIPEITPSEEAITEAPTEVPTEETTEVPTEQTEAPTEAPTEVPTEAPTEAPTEDVTDPTTEPTPDETVPGDPGDIGHGGVPDTPGSADTRPTGHDHQYTATVVAPTCEKIGYTQYECVCGQAYRNTPKDPIGHKYTITKTIAPTETENGYDLHICERCGDSYKNNYVCMTGDDHTGYFWADCDNDGKCEWWPRDCSVEGHRYKSEVIQDATCCQPELIDARCTVVGCNHQKEGYPRENWKVPHVGDASLITFVADESYTIRRTDGYAWNFDNEADVRAKAKEVADAYRNGESRHYVEWIHYSGYNVVYPETFTCKTCGQTINYQEMRKDYRAGFSGTLPENPYADRRWEERYTKDNQP